MVDLSAAGIIRGMETRMSIRELAVGFLRQTSAALSVLAGSLCVAERLVPGSVLPHLNIFWIASLAALVAALVPSDPSRRPLLRALGYVPLALLLVAFLFLLTADLGRSGWILTFSAAAVAMAFLISMAYPSHETYD